MSPKSMESRGRLPLRRFADKRGQTIFYRHPHGYKIKREVRDWDGRAYRGSMTGDPKVQWFVYVVGRLAVDTPTFTTLRAARAWCDGHPR